MLESLIGFAILLALVFLRMPIAIAMGLVGLVGFGVISGFKPAVSMAGRLVIDTGMDYGLSVVPLFILMGNMVSRSGLARELYSASNAFLGHFRGGLSMATIVACGGFSAICGSSLATAATMAKVAMPPMRHYRYADSLATASIAAGGTLGILIPPSVILVIYGLITESSIGKLFAAGLIPGIIGIVFYLGAVRYAVWRSPEAGPAGERLTWRKRIVALNGVWGTLLLFVIVMGGIYGGVFTPTEAAGIGAGGATLIALFRGSLNLSIAFEVLTDTARTTASLFFILFGALIFSNFVNRAGLPDALIPFVTSFDVSAWGVMLLILLIYIVLGCVFESLSMLLLTVPVFFPLIQSLDFGMSPEEVLIWFGIVVVVVTEISLITPPVGLNIFVLNGVLPDVKTSTIFKGVTPFWVADIVRLLLLVFVSGLSLWMPFTVMPWLNSLFS